MKYRTHNLGELRITDAGKTVKLSGWLENVRKVSKTLYFLILRDFYGITQVIVTKEEHIKLIDSINAESVICVEGIVRERTSKNSNIDTGDIEIEPIKIEVLGKCKYNALPFEINYSQNADENNRLKYRYLDLRNPFIKSKIVLRSKVISEIRRLMDKEGFLEITTPILTASSPEGARDYLVPARTYPGMFYALPQAPQQFKQLLMVSGFDKYYQVAPCFRDEDARSDRSPTEFYQFDMEMCFATQEDVFNVIEKVLHPIFSKYGKYKSISSFPFKKIKYKDAINTYGTDKPDLRIDLKITDITQFVKNIDFDMFKESIIKAVIVPDFNESRKYIDNLIDEVYNQTGNKLLYFKTDEDNKLTSGISKYLTEDIINKLNLSKNSLVCICCGNNDEVCKTLGVAIKLLGNSLPNHINKESYEFCWIVDYPLYEIGEESGKLEFSHNPFSMPQVGLEELNKIKNEEDALNILAYQYDLVCNGIELSSGAVRNHDPEIMIKAFDLVGISKEEVKTKFSALYNAFCYGAPPHAGIAPGIDRIIMLLTTDENIREVIPFPVNSKGQDLMMGAPSKIDDKALKDVHIKVIE